MSRSPKLLITAAAAAVALTLIGCSQPSQVASGDAADEGASEWPRTIEITGPNDEVSTLRIEAEPQQIAALDYESAEVLAEVGLADRLVLVPEAVLNPVLGGHVDELSDVPNTFPVAMEVDAETVIAASPDLVVMSTRHSNEKPIADVLHKAGITTLQLPTSWTSPESLSGNIDLIGQATGSDIAAGDLIESIESGLRAEASDTAAEEGPRVLVLTNQAGKPFVTAGGAYPLELLRLAGARSLSDELGFEHSGPISAEQVVDSNPDGIVLIDMNGTGDRMYTELLENPAVASLDAIADDRMLRIGGRQVQAMGLTETVDGLATLTAWVSELGAR